MPTKTFLLPTLRFTTTKLGYSNKRITMRVNLRSSTLLLALALPAVVTARAILGVDLGSLYMKVALVQSGSPLEIVTNMHSKRKTEQMVLFDRSQRFYGADAAALLARKSQHTPTSMSLMLGRDDQHPVVQVSERGKAGTKKPHHVVV
jgi:molecular chaperone DnaK (HSP70)